MADIIDPFDAAAASAAPTIVDPFEQQTQTKPELTRGEHVKAMWTDIPSKVYDAGAAALSSANEAFNPWSKTQTELTNRKIEQAKKPLLQAVMPDPSTTLDTLKSTGSGLLSPLEAGLAIPMGAYRSVVGHGFEAAAPPITPQMKKLREDMGLPPLASGDEVADTSALGLRPGVRRNPTPLATVARNPIGPELPATPAQPGLTAFKREPVVPPELPSAPPSQPIGVSRDTGARLLSPNISHVPDIAAPEYAAEALASRRSVGAAGTSPLEGVSPEAIRHIHASFEGEGLTQHTLAQRLEEMSPHQFLSEIGDSPTFYARGITASPGLGGTELKGSFRSRAQEAPQRMGTVFDQVFGKESNAYNVAKIISRDQKKASEPAYRAWRETQVPFTDEMAELQLLSRLKEAGAFSKAKELAGISGIPWNEEQFVSGVAGKYPTARSWDLIKRSLDSKISKAFREGDNTTGSELKTLRGDLLKALDEHPDANVRGVWKNARNVYAGPAKIKEALQYGRELLARTVDADEFSARAANFSPAELDAMKTGVRAYLKDKLGRPGRQNLSTLNDVLAENNLQKLRALLGDAEAAKLERAVRHEYEMHFSPQNLANSLTAEKLAAQDIWAAKDSRLEKVIKTGAGLIKHPVKTLTGEALEAQTARAMSKRQLEADQIRRDAGRIFSLQGAERDAVAQWILEHGANYTLPTKRALGGRVTVNTRAPISRKYDVPYLAGASDNGQSVYIDRRVPQRIKLGKAYIDPSVPLRIHEMTEWALMTKHKLSYEAAHKRATAAERHWVESHGHSWALYEETMDGFLSHIEHEHPKKPPPDLYLKPYPHDKQKLLEKNRAAGGMVGAEAADFDPYNWQSKLPPAFVTHNSPDTRNLNRPDDLAWAAQPSELELSPHELAAARVKRSVLHPDAPVAREPYPELQTGPTVPERLAKHYGPLIQEGNENIRKKLLANGEDPSVLNMTRQSLQTMGANLFGVADDPLASSPTGVKRIPTWPEHMAVSGATLPSDVITGKYNIKPTVPGMWSDEDENRRLAAEAEAFERVQDMTGLAGNPAAGTRARVSGVPHEAPILRADSSEVGAPLAALAKSQTERPTVVAEKPFELQATAAPNNLPTLYKPAELGTDVQNFLRLSQSLEKKYGQDWVTKLEPTELATLKAEPALQKALANIEAARGAGVLDKVMAQPMTRRDVFSTAGALGAAVTNASRLGTALKALEAPAAIKPALDAGAAEAYRNLGTLREGFQEPYRKLVQEYNTARENFQRASSKEEDVWNNWADKAQVWAEKKVPKDYTFGYASGINEGWYFKSPDGPASRSYNNIEQAVNDARAMRGLPPVEAPGGPKFRNVENQWDHITGFDLRADEFLDHLNQKFEEGKRGLKTQFEEKQAAEKSKLGLPKLSEGQQKVLDHVVKNAETPPQSYGYERSPEASIGQVLSRDIRKLFQQTPSQLKGSEKSVGNLLSKMTDAEKAQIAEHIKPVLLQDPHISMGDVRTIVKAFPSLKGFAAFSNTGKIAAPLAALANEHALSNRLTPAPSTTVEPRLGKAVDALSGANEPVRTTPPGNEFGPQAPAPHVEPSVSSPEPAQPMRPAEPEQRSYDFARAMRQAEEDAASGRSQPGNWRAPPEKPGLLERLRARTGRKAEEKVEDAGTSREKLPNPFLDEAEANTGYQPGMSLFADSSRVGAPISAFAPYLEKKRVGEFRANLMEAVNKRAAQLQEQANKLHESGELPYAPGTRFTTKHSREHGLLPWKVLGPYVNPKDPRKIGYRVERGVEGEPGWERSTIYTKNPDRPEIEALAQGFQPFGDLKLLSTKDRAHGGRVNADNINPNPSDAQKEAGNYAKDKVHIHGLPITIENAKGSYREGVGADSVPWRTKLPANYGYLLGSEGADKDHVDVYVGPYTKCNHVFIIDQKHERTGEFDEHKVLVCFPNKQTALKTYIAAFSDGKGKDRIGAVHALTVPALKQWLEHGDTKSPYKPPVIKKVPHSEVDYTPKAMNPKNRCGVCLKFIPANMGGPDCVFIAKPINPNGWCNRFRRV